LLRLAFSKTHTIDAGEDFIFRIGAESESHEHFFHNFLYKFALKFVFTLKKFRLLPLQ
jgi:hypothetical protein